MNYDDWKLESPEDENERVNGPRNRRLARLEYLADQRDEFMEAEQMEKNNDSNCCDARMLYPNRCRTYQGWSHQSLSLRGNRTLSYTG
jgi:hypothetical protein